jgi:hypothetical protein
MEQIAGTNPASAGDFPVVTAQLGANGQKLSMTVQPGRVYHVETSPALGTPSWTRRSSYTHPAASAAQVKEFTANDPPVAGTTRQFYRIVVEMAP